MERTATVMPPATAPIPRTAAAMSEIMLSMGKGRCVLIWIRGGLGGFIGLQKGCMRGS